ncbi:MAG: hypothetical protein LBL36_03610 [Clostridiales Family XIII bacterium]|jgi:hypothetical protein|nr:hypothetical protein [Clostridiales Family XIII bacterium]
MKAIIGAIKNPKIIAIAILLVAIIGGVAGYYLYDKTHTSPAEETAGAARDAIVFQTAAGEDKALDPVSASLETEDGVPKTWIVTDAGGNTVVFGVGNEFKLPWGLAAGTYTVTWEVADKGGAVENVTREFSIGQ